jgi:hypothetical protein
MTTRQKAKVKVKRVKVKAKNKKTLPRPTNWTAEYFTRRFRNH